MKQITEELVNVVRLNNDSLIVDFGKLGIELEELFIKTYFINDKVIRENADKKIVKINNMVKEIEEKLNL